MFFVYVQVLLKQLPEGLAASEGKVVGRIWKTDQLLVGGAPCQVRALPPPALALCTHGGVLPVLVNAKDVARSSIFGGWLHGCVWAIHPLARGEQASTHYPRQITAGQSSFLHSSLRWCRQAITPGFTAAQRASARGKMAAMQALSKPFVGQKIECRSARQNLRVRSTMIVRAAQEEQNLVRRTSTRERNSAIPAMCYLHFQSPLPFTSVCR